MLRAVCLSSKLLPQQQQHAQGRLVMATRPTAVSHATGQSKAKVTKTVQENPHGQDLHDRNKTRLEALDHRLVAETKSHQEVTGRKTVVAAEGAVAVVRLVLL